MLKRGGKSSYNPYSTGQRVKKESREKDRLDILPNKHTVWLKQVCFDFLPTCSSANGAAFSSLRFKVCDLALSGKMHLFSCASCLCFVNTQKGHLQISYPKQSVIFDTKYSLPHPTAAWTQEVLHNAA